MTGAATGAALARLARDNRGAAAAMFAIILPGLIGISALGAETGVWFTIKLQNQAAADAAAIAAAYQVLAGKTDLAADLTPAASEAAARNGYRGTTPVVVYPYSDAVAVNGIGVTLQQTQGAMLASLFLADVTVATRAVAVIETLNHSCVLALGSSNTGLQVADATMLQMPRCIAAANSISSNAIDLDGATSSITAATLVTAGGVAVQGSPINPLAPPPQLILATPPAIGAPAIADPYAGILTHAVLTAGMPTVGRCRSSGGGGVRVYNGNCVISGTSLTQRRIKLTANTQISGTWAIATGQTVDLAHGTYWVTGDLDIAAGAVLECSTCDNSQGLGVTIILTAQSNTVGAVSVAAGAMINLNAPNSGSLAGIVMAQDSNALPTGTTYSSNHSTIGGAPGASLNGLIYFPNSSLTFHGNASPVGPKCLLLVVGALQVDATSSLDISGCMTAGLAALPTLHTVALAE